MKPLVYLTLLLPLSTTAQNLIAVRPSKPDFTLSQILNPVLSFLECTKGDSTTQLLCNVVSHRVSAALRASSISIDRNGILFNYDDPTSVKIDTGHSCTVTAQITHTHVDARLLSTASLDFSGNPLSLSDPALFVAELPVDVNGRYDVKQKFGTRILTGCTNLGSDSFKATGGISTTAKIAILFTFAPAPVQVDAQGNYIFTIRPITKVAAGLVNTDIKFNISGVSFLNGLLTAILGGTSSLFKAVTGILKGDNLKAIWKNVQQHVIDVAVGGILSTPFDLLDDLIELLAQSVVDERKKGLEQKYSGEMEKQLRGLVSKALGLDVNGERKFVIRREVVDLVGRFGLDYGDLFLTDKPAGYCVSDAECSDGIFCNGVERCVGNSCVGASSRPCFGSDERCVEGSKTCVSTCGRNGRICPRKEKVKRVHVPLGGFCTHDSECQDGNWCNGYEWCVANWCVSGSPSCGVDQRCDEAAQRCVSNCGSGGRICPKDVNVTELEKRVPVPVALGGYCTSDAECNDGKWCNGEEKCVANACVAGFEACGVDEVCTESPKRCISTCGRGTGRICPKDVEVKKRVSIGGYCTTDAECSDGVWCNGDEKCVANTCVVGYPWCPGTDEVCIESTKTCIMTCGRGGRMCPKDVGVKKRVAIGGYCTADAECSDGVWCNGDEKCVANTCVAGDPWCDELDEVCSESTKRCISKCGPAGNKCLKGRAIAAE